MRSLVRSPRSGPCKQAKLADAASQSCDAAAKVDFSTSTAEEGTCGEAQDASTGPQQSCRGPEMFTDETIDVADLYDEVHNGTSDDAGVDPGDHAAADDDIMQEASRPVSDDGDEARAPRGTDGDKARAPRRTDEKKR